MFDISSIEQEFEQFAYDPEDLKRIFQHQQERHKLAKSEIIFRCISRSNLPLKHMLFTNTISAHHLITNL